MVKHAFSTTWKRSVQQRKQRKYRYNAPLHLKQKMLKVHLSKELRQKHGMRSVQIRTGDKAKVMVGKFKGKEGKVEAVNLKSEKVFITGLEQIKKDGTKSITSFNPSNLMIVSLKEGDKKRKTAKKSKKNGTVVSVNEKQKNQEKKEVKKVENKQSKDKQSKDKQSTNNTSNTKDVNKTDTLDAKKESKEPKENLNNKGEKEIR